MVRDPRSFLRDAIAHVHCGNGPSVATVAAGKVKARAAAGDLLWHCAWSQPVSADMGGSMRRCTLAVTTAAAVATTAATDIAAAAI